VRAGTVVLDRGTVIRPAEQSMLASLGRLQVRVIRRPRVALISTGDELVPPDIVPGPGQIRDSNRSGVFGQVESLGAMPVDLGLVPDDAAEIRAALERGLHDSDCVVTSGGVSVGDYDLTKQILAELGEIHFWRVAMKPGKPQAFGLARGKPIFGLPGNPVSSMVVFDQFVRPALLKMAGYQRLTRPRLRAVIDEPVRKPPGKVHFMRAVIDERNGRLHARLTGPQGSGILSSMTASNGLIILELDVTDVEEGDEVTVELWE
jgi:molybdopterin molybdotransferase